MREGDPAAWERFVTIFGGLLYDRIRRKSFSPEDAEDIVQEVFRKVQISFPTFVRDGKTLLFRRWLNKVVHSVMVDYVRKRAKEVRGGGGDAQARLQQFPDPISDLGESDEDGALLIVRTLEVIKQDFHPQVWQGFWKTQIERKTSVEAAKELETTPGAVRAGATRVIARLRNELRGLFE
jgi:RNA polymerase sigma factor (sigma-70 family)